MDWNTEETMACFTSFIPKEFSLLSAAVVETWFSGKTERFNTPFATE